MKITRWFSALSFSQRVWLFATAAGMMAIVAFGILTKPAGKEEKPVNVNPEMSIREIAPGLGITGKALARELGLPLDVPKNTPLNSLSVTVEELEHVTAHLLSHRDAALKYYVYAVLVLGGVVFLVKLGRPYGAGIDNRREWYPRFPYVLSLLLSVIVAGFLLGKSPNPMEGAVKVLKSMVGLYPDPSAKMIAFAFFLVLAVVGNKIICGWACPFGALQELIFSLPILEGIKRKKLPFAVTNTIRTALFVTMLLLLFDVIGGRKGTVIYHYVNPFNLFNLDIESCSVLLTIVLALGGSFAVYRPFCQLICPFGLVSWAAERLSIYRVQIDGKSCIQCGACARACPLEAAQGRVDGKNFPADCFSCARCLNVCPTDAIKYTSIFSRPAKRS